MRCPRCVCCSAAMPSRATRRAGCCGGWSNSPRGPTSGSGSATARYRRRFAIMAEKPWFSKDLERLEQIVRKLESQDLDLDEALKLFEEGVERLRAVRERLAAA